VDVKIKEFIRPITENCRIRHKHSRIKTKIVEFSVQLEIFRKNKWIPIVRYDTAHGVAHRDQIHPDGTVDKTPIFCLDYGDALVFAERDLISNWRGYIDRFLKEVKKND